MRSFLKANQSIDKILKAKGEQDRRKKNVQQMQADAVSDHEEDDQNAAQMAAAAQAQARALQADDGDPEPEVLQQILFPRQVGNVLRSCHSVPALEQVDICSRLAHRRSLLPGREAKNDISAAGAPGLYLIPSEATNCLPKSERSQAVSSQPVYVVICIRALQAANRCRLCFSAQGTYTTSPRSDNILE